MILSTLNNILSFNLIQKISLSKNYCVRSPAWDFFWLHSGLWLGLIIFGFSNQPKLETFYMIGVFLFWISHRFSSFYIAWFTKTYRTVRASQPWRFVIFPIIFVLGLFVLLFIPENVFPVPVPARILGLLLLDFFWGMHHFAAQHYGILRLFIYRANLSSCQSSKFHDRLFCWGTGFVMVFIAELLHGVSFLQQKKILPAIPHDWGNEVISITLRSGTFIVLVITVIMVRNAVIQNSGLPRILYIIGLGLMVIGAFQLHPIEFLMLWTLQHWITALGLAAQMGGNDFKKSILKKKIIFEKKLFSEHHNQWIVLLPLCSFSVIMTPFFEIEAVSSGARYSELLLPSFIYWLENSSWLLCLVGVSFASGFLHYYMDKAVYRFSDAETCKSAKSLLFS